MAKQPATPIVRLFYQDNELSVNVDKFEYTYGEGSSDICAIGLTFGDDDKNLDPEYFRDREEYKVVWGYIGEPQITKKIYLQQKIWNYEKNVSVDLLFTDKAGDMIAASSYQVYNKANLLDIAKAIADKHDLKLKVELPAGDDGTKTLTLTEVDKLNPAPQTGVNSDFLNFEKQERAKTFKYPIRIGNDPVTDYDNLIWKNGAWYEIMVDGSQELFLDPVGAESEFQKYLQENFKGTIYTTNFKKVRYHGSPLERIQTPEQEKDTTFQIFRDPVRQNLINVDSSFTRYRSIPQAGATDRSFVNELGYNDPNGQTIVDTTEDEMIVRKRNFRQKPYRAFEYRGQDGQVLKFTPQYRRYDKGGPANVLGYSSWDNYSKSVIDGSASGPNNSFDQIVAPWQREIELLKNFNPESDLGTFVLDANTKELFYDPFKKQWSAISPPHNFGLTVPTESRADKTITPAPKVIATKQISVKQGIEILNNDIKEAYKTWKKITDANVNNAADSWIKASNVLNEAKLKEQPAELEVEGDTGLKVGLMLTMLGTLPEHMGHYYIIECKHTIGKQGYITRMTLVRDGNAFKFKKGVDMRSYGRKDNNDIGELKSKHKKSISEQTP